MNIHEDQSLVVQRKPKIMFFFSLTNPQRGWLITPEGCAPKGQEAPKGAGRKRKRGDNFGLNRD